MKFSPKDMLIDIVLLFLVAGVALILSFTFTGSDASLGVLILYFLEPTILLCNFIPLFLLTLFFYFALGRTSRSAAAVFLIVALMGVVQASKLHYRYENFKFSDLLLAREGAKMMANQFSPLISFPPSC